MFAARFFALTYFARHYFPKGADSAPVETSGITESHRFVSTQVPSFDDLGGVQRFLQRMMDDVSRALNPVRSVADGGTGIDALAPGEILAGGQSGNAFSRVPGNKTTVRMFLVMEGDGFTATPPFWAPLREEDLPVTVPSSNRVLVGTDAVLVGTGNVIYGAGSTSTGTRVLFGTNVIVVGTDPVVI